ncbi:MAG: hypothetical protein NC416_04590 [Eubacterium sp.]|nr:hypothetical protein [Eubacterium sp.]
MAKIMRVEMQDSDGNIVHPHTEAKVVFLEDGTTLEQKLTEDVSKDEIRNIFNNDR